MIIIIKLKPREVDSSTKLKRFLSSFFVMVETNISKREIHTRDDVNNGRAFKALFEAQFSSA